MPILIQLGTLSLHHHCSAPDAASAQSRGPVHHAIVVDCSYSMAGELPRLVAQLQNKLPSLLSPGDFVTLVWFSGRREAGRILDHEPVQGLKDIARLQSLLAKWLKPVGMTGFLDPAKLVLESFTKGGTGVVRNLVFMSDGCENQNSRSEVLGAFEALGRMVDSATVVEYGYYADRALLTKLAEAASGSVVLAKDFASYDLVFENALSMSARAKVPMHTIEVAALEGVVFSIDASKHALRVFSVVDGVATVPDGVDVYWLARERKGAPVPKKASDIEGLAAGGLYAALAVFAHRMSGPLVHEILSHVSVDDLGDLFSKCFGKQRYQDFIERVVDAAVQAIPLQRKAATVRKDRSTLIDFLHGIEAAADGGKLYLKLDEFLPTYEKISLGREDNSGLGVRFERTSDRAEIRGVTWNEERPNVSLLTKQEGDAVVPVSMIPEKLRGRFHVRAGDQETRIATHIFRNYAIVKDGIIHGARLPVVQQIERPAAEAGEKEIGIDLTKISVLNWNDVARVSATEFFRDEFRLHAARSLQKVLKALLNEKAPEALAEARSAALSKVFGDEAADWLRSIGVTDNGYAPPKTASAAPRDCYLGRALKVSMKGYSSLPSVKEVREMIKKGKVAPRATFMADYLKIYENADEKHLATSLKVSIGETRRLIMMQAKVRFALLVGQVWFHEFASLDENTLTVDGIEYKAEMVDVEIEV